MNYSGLIKNDFINGDGICVSFFVQGCPRRCEGCHNPESWNFNGGTPVTQDTYYEILEAISKNGFQRNFSVLGGEPLCPENIRSVYFIVEAVRQTYPNIKIYLWTGYTLEELKEMYKGQLYFNSILGDINYLIDGPYEEDKRDITLHLRGSSNQRVLEKGVDF